MSVHLLLLKSSMFHECTNLSISPRYTLIYYGIATIRSLYLTSNRCFAPQRQISSQSQKFKTVLFARFEGVSFNWTFSLPPPFVVSAFLSQTKKSKSDKINQKFKYQQCDQMLEYKQPNFLKTCPTSSRCRFYLKCAIFQNCPKSYRLFGLFLKKLCSLDLSKVAQSGHTEYLAQDKTRGFKTEILTVNSFLKVGGR